MRRIIADKKELEHFLDWIESWYSDINTGVFFQEFKKYFCDDEIDLLSIKGVNYIDLYDKWISKKNSNIFFRKVREYIIQKFTEYSYFCPYCWKNPLIHFDENNENKRMFQFDHFFPKSKYSKLAINFYNLVPSCNACNHLKWKDNPLDGTSKNKQIFHPYFWWMYKDAWKVIVDDTHAFDDKFHFDWKAHTLNSKHSEFFNLDTIYLNSEDTFNEFRFMYDKYSKMKVEKYSVLKWWSCKTDEAFKRQYFSWYYSENESDVLKYSNGKFKKDLIEKMKI